MKAWESLFKNKKLMLDEMFKQNMDKILPHV